MTIILSHPQCVKEAPDCQCLMKIKPGVPQGGILCLLLVSMKMESIRRPSSLKNNWYFPQNMASNNLKNMHTIQLIRKIGGMAPWRPFMGDLYRHPIFLLSGCSPFEERAPQNKGTQPIFQWPAPSMKMIGHQLTRQASHNLGQNWADAVNISPIPAQFWLIKYTWCHCLSGKLWYLQHNCVGDTIVYH